MTPLRILVVATKTPWPAADGGRLVLLTTLEALAAAGHHIELVAPFAGPEALRRDAALALGEICTPHLVAATPRSAVAAALLGLARGLPATVVRHTVPAVRMRVAELLESDDFDVVHAEQLHALAQTGPSRAAGVPVLHRAHNVESLLWAFAAEHRGPPLRSLLALEARRMEAFEAIALETADCSVALTEVDRRLLAELAPTAAVHTVPPPFAGELPAGTTAVDGDPAVVTLISPSWAPSRDAVRDLVGRAWPAVRQRLPDAVLHVFGRGDGLTAGPGVVLHPAPAESRDAFPAEAVALVPSRHPTGVPMKALEAWARGLPLVVDRPTAEALGARDGVDAIVAEPPGGLAAALARLVGEDGLRQRLTAGGRRTLAERHDPARVADRLAQAYRLAMLAPSA